MSLRFFSTLPLWTFTLFVLAAVASGQEVSETLKDPREIHLRNIQQLTFDGQNAEAYFSFDGSKLIFQSTPRDSDHSCDQIYTMNIDGSERRLLSTGKGTTTCSFYYPNGKFFLYASTHEGGEKCPPPPDRNKGYVWALYEDFEIYKADLEGNIVQKLTESPGYDAEAVISPRGDRIVFTSIRSGDLELWTMDLDGGDLKQITNTPGYDGGAFFSPDGSKIVWRASRFENDAKGLEDYQHLLEIGMIRPGALDLFIMDADGSNPRQLTTLGKASFGPYFHPSGKKVIFSSNMNDPRGREFDLFMVNIDGSGLERITYRPDFDGFPMFSPDGKKFVWASNRNNEKPRETNVFVADWVDDPRQVVPEVEDYQQTPEIRANELYHHVRFLADDRLTGRVPGSDGAEFAARYIADRFAEYGLQTIDGSASYYQDFDFTGDVKLGKENRLALKVDGKEKVLELEKDYLPLAYSGPDPVTSDLVFAGYGISSPDDNYDDYAGLDVNGKVVLVFRSAPGGNEPEPDPNNPHAGAPPNALLKHADIRHKLVVARGKGAKGVLLVRGPAQADDLDELVKFETDFSFQHSGIAAASISRSVAGDIFAAAGKDIGELQKAIDENKEPKSFALSDIGAIIDTDVENVPVNTRNIVGYLPGKSDQTIIIGAHYDHLGFGGRKSLDEKPGQIHNGADDNASGTTGLLELAQYFGSQTEKLEHSLFFVAFAAEEYGLVGSKYYTGNPMIPAEKVKAMLNMDMIGRLKENKLVVQGIGTSAAWKEIVTKANEKPGFDLTLQADGPGPSDQSSFYFKEIPVLAFFTGAHKDYHRSTDDFNTLDYESAARIVDYVKEVTLEIDRRNEAMPFTRAESQQRTGGEGRSFKVTLGVMPDYTFEGKGLMIEVVKEGRPGSKAGLQNGDILIQFGKIQVNGIYDYMSGLRMYKPGDQVEIIAIRDGKEVKLTAILEE